MHQVKGLEQEPLHELGAKRPLQLLGQKRVWLGAAMEVAL